MHKNLINGDESDVCDATNPLYGDHANYGYSDDACYDLDDDHLELPPKNHGGDLDKPGDDALND